MKTLKEIRVENTIAEKYFDLWAGKSSPNKTYPLARAKLSNTFRSKKIQHVHIDLVEIENTAKDYKMEYTSSSIPCIRLPLPVPMLLSQRKKINLLIPQLAQQYLDKTQMPLDHPYHNILQSLATNDFIQG